MKRLMLTAALVLAASLASAQQPAPKTTLEFDQMQLQMLAEALTNLPKKLADPFIADLNRQITEQQQKARAAAEAAAKTEADKSK